MSSPVQFSRDQLLMKRSPVLFRRNALYAILAVCCAMLAANATVRGDETNSVATAKSDLFDKPLQELMQYITIAKRTPEPLEKTAAAVSVLTQDDIRRSGAATSIPEVALMSGSRT